MEFRNLYELTSKSDAKQKILSWIIKIKSKEITVFKTIANSLNYHLETILNFFNTRNTNAESFNSKVKLFRANQRGVVAVKIFHFRMEKLFS